MSWRLITSEGRAFRLQGAAVIGRSASAHIVLNDGLVSREHAELRVEGNVLMVRDLNSSNGTYVNGARITTPCTLRPGDRLTIGNTTLSVQWVSGRAIAPSPLAPGPAAQQPAIEYHPARYMYCPSCAAQIAENAEICPRCGVSLARREKIEVAPTVGEKDWLTTLLLCIFLGYLGAHRFYTGHIGIGVVQLLTGGLCGIWTIIDLISILTGSYRDAYGNLLLKK